MILLVGVTGRLGRAVATQLVKAGTSFRAACRDPTKANWLALRGVDVVPVDLATGTGIEAALSGARSVISCVHGLLGRSRSSIRRVDVEGHARLIDAAVEARVRRFVYISALGASADHPSRFWQAKALTEQHLRASGIDHVILRPSAFMDLYAHDLIGSAVLRGKTVFLLGSGTTPRNMVAVADVAKAAILAESADDLAGRTIEIGGWDNPTEREVAAVYAGLANRPYKVRSVPPPVLKMLAAVITPFHAGVGGLIRLPLQLAGRDDLRLDGRELKQLGIDPVGLREFAQSKMSAGEPAER